MTPDKKEDGTEQQAAQHRNTPINPFKDEVPEEDPQQQKEADIALEQQRKEALTERD